MLASRIQPDGMWVLGDPAFDSLSRTYPFFLLQTSGRTKILACVAFLHEVDGLRSKGVSWLDRSGKLDTLVAMDNFCQKE